MRSRNIKPGFFKNELLGTADPIVSLLFGGLWLLADRDGRLEDRPLRIKAEIFPYRESLDIHGSLTQLERMGFIVRYEVSGCAVIQILNFRKHQTPHSTEKAGTLPPPPDKSLTNNTTGSASVKPPEDHGELTAALPPDSSFPDSLIPDSPPCAREKSFFEKCYGLATKHFPNLTPCNSAIIRTWEAGGYDFERHVKPVMDSVKAKGAAPRSFGFFTGAIEDAAKAKMAPAPKVSSESPIKATTPDQIRRNNEILQRYQGASA